MIEIDALSLVSREPLKIRFSSDEYGSIGLARKASIGQMVACDRGVCFELKEEAKTRSIVSDGLHWFRFRARDLGDFFNKNELSQDVIDHVAKTYPDMACHSWEEIEREHLHRHDFKRAKRPLVCFESFEGPCWAVLWEIYPAMARIGVYIGRDAKGLGGYVCFFDRAEFKIL
jgi:hypothetical protein